MLVRKITINLNTRDINRAIREVEKYKKELKQKTLALIKALTDRGEEIAKAQVRQLDAFYTGELEASIEGYFSPSWEVGIIKAGAWYAAYVEFGTGIVGEQSPHPDPQGWQYDVNSHGEKGWWYFNDRDQKWHWTKGFQSRPFMYNTVKELERECRKIALGVFGHDRYRNGNI